MKFFRVGDKVISWDKVSTAMREILRRRSRGATQQEVAKAFGIERAFVSYLEGIGSIRKGNRLAIVGFPVANKEEVKEAAEAFGVELVYLLSEEERRDFVSHKSGARLFNQMLEIMAELRDYDLIIVLASDKRTAMIEKILNQEVISLPIGKSPLTEDEYVDIKQLRRLLQTLTNGERKPDEEGSQRESWLFKKRPRRRNRAARSKI